MQDAYTKGKPVKIFIPMMDPISKRGTLRILMVGPIHIVNTWCVVGP